MSNKFLKRTIAITTSVTTMLSLSGISLLAPIFVATASSHIMDGDLIMGNDNPDVFIAKHVGTKKFKRLILNPDVFNSYGHLSWNNIKTVSKADLDEHVLSELVRAEGDPKVYRLTSAANSDTGEKHWLNMTAAEFTSEGYDWDSIYQINAVDRDNYTASSDVTPGGGNVSASLASNTPAAQTVAKGAADVVFTRVNLTGSATINSITVTRSGLANDADLTNVKLWDGSTQLGSIQALNTTTHKATFTGLNWMIAGTKTLTITGTIASGTTGNAPRLGVAVASDIAATNSSISVMGSFPVVGNAMTLAGISVGVLDVDLRTVPADNSPISGSTDQEIASWTLAADSVEGFNVTKIVLTETGSSVASDISNIKLKVNGVQIGSTVSSLVGDQAIFDLSGSPLVINASGNKIVYAHADIAAGVTTARTVDFEITETKDVVAFGANSGGSVVITKASGGSGTAFTAQSGTAQTISQGTILTVATNGATNPSAQDFVVGTYDNLISAFKFSAGSGETQRVTRIKMQLVGTGAGDVDLSNVRLYKHDVSTGTETLIDSSASFSSNIATWGANSSGLDAGLFDLAAGENTVVHVRADVPTGASWTTLEIVMNEVRVDGVQSAGDIGAAVVTSIDALGEVVTHNASVAKGTLTMAISPNTPPTQDVVPGKLGHEFGRVDLSATGEDIILTSLIVDLCDAAICTNEASNTTVPAEAGDFTNVKLYKADGTQIGSTVASPSTQATFSFSLTIKKNTTETLYVKADVPTDAASLATRWNTDIAAVGFDRDVTATGVASGATITDPTADALGTAQTAVGETLTVAFQAVPYSTVVKGATNAIISKVVLTAGTAGDVKVTRVKLTAATTTTMESNSASNTDFGTLKLWNASTNMQVGSTLSTFTDAVPDTATFTALAITVPAGGQVVLELRATILATSDTYFVGMGDLTAAGGTDVTGVGLVSNATVDGTGTDHDDSGEVTLASAGTLTVAVDAATPLASYVAVGGTVGKTGVEFSKWKFTANNEAIELTGVKVTLPTEDNDTSDDNDVPNFAGIHLYNGSTEISTTGFLSGTNVGGAKTHTFTIPAGTLIIPKDGSVTLTLKADMNGTSNGANSTTTPKFHLADVAGATDGTASNITAKGVSSGGTVTSSAGTPNPETASLQNAKTVVKSKPIFALCTASNCSQASPSGTLAAGVTEVIRFLITAEGDDVDFDATNHNIRFTIVQSGGAAANRDVDLYEKGVSAAIATTITVSNMTSSGTINFTDVDTTIAGGTSKEYYVEADLTDYATAGENFRLRILNAAADLSWTDSLSNDISIANLTDGMPLNGNTLLVP